MAKTHKTKTEMLQELESIKGLLLENDDIPLLQEVEIMHQAKPLPSPASAKPITASPAVTLPEPQREPLSHTQTSLFDDEQASEATVTADTSVYDESTIKPQYTAALRQPIKAAGENPFLPQHIRERLHGNNPPPLFANVTARKIMNANKNMQPKNQSLRQQLLDDVITSIMPQVESELRHRLFAMSTDELERLLKIQE